MPHNIKDLLKLMASRTASDLHITSGSPVQLRIDENLVPVDRDPLSDEESRSLIFSLLTEAQIEKFEQELELDIAIGAGEIGRFRVNVFKQKGSVASAIRLIPNSIWSFEKCGLPADVAINLCNRPKGLVLLTGSTGSGKSTSLASMIDWINTNRSCHIITVEDPIEYVHKNKKSIVNQREVNSDTHSFSASLKHVLRQDPDVILIGEMRDLETIEAALVIAETGHLVFATLHTSDCVQTVNRIVDVFPSHQQPQVRTQLSFVLLSVLSQQLIPRAEGPGRVLAIEILMATPPVRSMMRESKMHQLYSVIQTSKKDGMKTMNQSLYDLYANKSITYDEAFERTTDVDDLGRLFKNK